MSRRIAFTGDFSTFNSRFGTYRAASMRKTADRDRSSRETARLGDSAKILITPAYVLRIRRKPSPPLSSSSSVILRPLHSSSIHSRFATKRAKARHRPNERYAYDDTIVTPARVVIRRPRRRFTPDSLRNAKARYRRNGISSA